MVTRLASKSQQLYEKAKELIPGGVNSPVRSYPPYPLFLKSAHGSRFRTVDDEEYLDYCMAYGALLDGHAYPETVRAVKTAVENGTVFGQPTEQEVLLAKLISDLIPSVQMVRLANSGTEATMHALRLSRGFTGRSKILKFEGGFHGSHDGVLVKAGSGASTLASPDSLGIPQETVKNTLVARYNDEGQVRRIIHDHTGDVASVIVEPVMGNMGPILPEPGFLESLREITAEESIVLIFDEVITGFRLALGGAQEYYGVKPDLTVLGKVLGGGLPLSAFGGKREIMEKLAPLGGVYQAGTYSGNPVSVSAGLATLQSLRTRAGQVYPSLESAGEILRSRIAQSAEPLGLNVQVNGVGSMFQVFFTDKPVVDYQSAKTSNSYLYHKFFQSLLQSHVFVPPSQFETCFLSTSHSTEQIEDSLAAIDTAFRATIGLNNVLLRVGTRGSKLSIAQTDLVIEKLQVRHRGLTIEKSLIMTQGDVDKHTPLFRMDQIGIFEKEVNQAVLDGRVDFAIHSMKDIPVYEEDTDLVIAGVPERGSAADVIVSRENKTLDELRPGSTVGTSSLLRVAQLKRAWPNLMTEAIRGNVETRILKVEQGEYDAVILAEAGLDRLGLSHKIAQRLPLNDFLPAPGQGIISPITKRTSKVVIRLLESAEHSQTRAEGEAERELVKTLEGGCKVPIGALATTSGRQLRLTGCVLSADGRTRLEASGTGEAAGAALLGREVGKDLLSQGARLLEESWRELLR